MSWQLNVAYVGAGLALAVLAGCNSPQTVDSSGGAYREVAPPTELIAAGNGQIPDVPVPLGFGLDEGRSRSFTAGGARYVDNLYKGRADRETVARFFRRQMPIPRWVLVTEMFVQGERVLDFEKETEKCRIIISEGSWWNPTQIKVAVWTSGRIDTGRDGKGLAKR